MKKKKVVAAGLLAVLLATPVAQAQFTWNGTSNLSGTQAYDGLGVDSALDPHTFGSTSANSYIGVGNTGVFNVRSGSLTWINGNPNIGRNSGGNGTVNVSAGAALAINNDGTWGSSIGHGGATGVLNVGDGASMTWILSGNNEQRLMVGNGSSGNGTININGGTMTVANDVAETLDDDFRGFRVGSDTGIGTLNLNGGTLEIGASSFALDGAWAGMNSTPVFNEGGSGTLNINDGDLVFNGSTVIGFGTNAVINFTSWGSGKISLLGYTSPDYSAMAAAGILQIDGVTQSDLSNFTFSTEGSQGVLTAHDVVPSTPAVPADISASVVSSSITVSWNAEFGTFYTIYRSTTSGGGYTQVGSQYGSPFEDTLPEGTTYYYVVTSSRTGGGESAYSDEVMASSSPPPAPTTRKIWMNGTTAKLYWNEAAGSTGYIVKQTETPGTGYVDVASTAGLEYWVSNLVEGTTYYFAIAGENENGEGDRSLELSGTVTNFSVISDVGGTWENSIYTLPEAVFDGDAATAYDGASVSAWVGIDLGAGNERACPAIDFIPRAGNAARMNGAVFQGSNDGLGWDVLATISATPAYDWNRIYASANGTTDYRYFRCFGAVNGNVAEIKFLTMDEVDDVFHSTTPSDGAIDVAVDAGISVAFTDVLVDFNSLVGSWQMLVNSNVVSASKDSSGGVTTFTYASPLAYDTEYAVELKVYRTDGVTNAVDFSFTTIPDYFGGAYLIAPGIRNGGFELVSGSPGNTTTITDFTQIDNWDKVSGGSVGTRYDLSAPEGQRYLRTQRGMRIYNLTDHAIEAGDSFDFKWTHFQRPAGVIVGLCYSNGVEGVVGIVDSQVTVADATWIYGEWSGSYTFTNGHPAIGSTLGLMIQENPMTEGELTTTEGCVDKVILRYASGPSSAPVIQYISVSGDTVTLSWTADSVGTYSIERKTSLTTGSWIPVASGIPAGNQTTNVTASGANQEFYQIRGE